MDKATYTPLMCYAVSLIYFNLLGRKQTPLLRSFHDLPGPLRLVGKKMNGDWLWYMLRSSEINDV